MYSMYTYIVQLSLETDRSKHTPAEQVPLSHSNVTAPALTLEESKA